ncbi:LOW QUALITY PROTEIN: hypothetical protein KUTeg_007023 [Tegillarca granosa]|uniref:AAA+ ATPase domain-containing protein n=1 Tax=Tegillarca granosa TaxID=220873 RepID=A0ABQ9FC14_TEGGR|nr:LOW QUALITY PROTEIN: hypothetical protein KUTeg_007023 [Tegillarca granosa]
MQHSVAMSPSFFGKDENNGQKLLVVLAELFLIPSYTAEICNICGRFILDIVERAEEKIKGGSIDDSRGFMVALSIGVTICPDLKSFAKQYLQKTLLLHTFSDGNKRSLTATVFKNEAKSTTSAIPYQMKEYCLCKWNWVLRVIISLMVVFFVGYCANATAEMLGMSSAQREKLLKRFITNEDILRQLRIRHGVLSEAIKDEKTSPQLPVERIQNALQSVADSDLHKNVVMVAGIMLPKLAVQQEVALLGTYQCTDIPGEFVWQPGVLTRAVTEGHWVLLEDIDCAPMDVVSILLPLLERNILLLGSKSGWHRQQSNSSAFLEKLWTKINVEPLSRGELEQVVCIKYPKLSSVVDKLLDIYFMLSAGKHEVSSDDRETLDTDTGNVGKFLSHDGRLISTSFKPVDLRHIVKPFREDFENIFRGTFNQKENTTFLGHIQQCFVKQNWSTMFTLIGHTVEPALKRYQTGKISSEMYDNWVNIKKRLQQLKLQVKETENVLAFAFIEGTLVQAIRYGDWVLLDEINLAAAETLDCLSGLLESRSGSVVLTERGDVEPIIRHDNFRLFACMNPATDVGKKDLSVGIRNRFTELYVDELLETQDLKILVNDYLRGLSLTGSQLNGIVKFYTVVRDESIKHLTDGTGHRPHFSLRTLCRALKFAAPNPCGIFFLTQLDRSSHPLVENLICQHVIGKANVKAMLKQQLPMPPGGVYLKFEGYWISAGSLSPSVPDNYILTPSVRANLHDLARIVSGGQYPVLLQGETSVGKTSLVTWLGRSSGNVCVRVNNHEHTDLQEYVGSYSADSSGKLVFKEGVLVEAMRKGHWIILDELNLAPTDVLEALNRLLDDNRELFIPETQQTVKAHPKFMLFATQNPPGQYGGRKMLSRAFRNRFVELHFDEIPSNELETILHNRCHIPMSYAKRLVAVMLELQVIWAERYKCMDSIQSSRFYDWDQHLADHGYMLLAGRVRKQEEAAVVQEVIQKHLKRSVNPDHLFTFNSMTSATSVDILKSVTQQSLEGFEHVVWTYNMRRLAVLIGQAIKYQEPILLVGETGCGKTTVCQMYSVLHKTKLHSINCHLHTESADFLGGLRPCRTHEKNQDGGEKLFEWVDGPLVLAMKEGSMFLVDEISLADDSVLERLNSVLEPERTLLLAEKCGGDGNQNEVEKITAGDNFRICATMNPGGDFGKKELSPALRNRFTEIWCPQSSSRDDLIAIIEHNVKSGIHLCNQEDGSSGIGKAIMEFVDWFRNNEIGKRCVVSIRDILSWVSFINTCSKTLVTEEDVQEESVCNQLDPALAFIHGACLVFLDGLGAGTTSRGKDSDVEHTRLLSLDFLLNLVNKMTHQSYNLNSLGLVDKKSQVDTAIVQLQSDRLIIWPFSIERGPVTNSFQEKYALTAPTTCVNAQRILRGLQLARPLLLEGSPGVGKTSLVSAIAKASGHELVRINLSEQTDVTDLFGADLPVEGADGGVFAWRDGPLLQALKAGHWIVLDELNLASQSVLEGLNACLDHRGEVYIPELGKTFHIQHQKTRLFACQNPLNQGGGRKGLPRSFLNRFTQNIIYQDGGRKELSRSFLNRITQSKYPKLGKIHYMWHHKTGLFACQNPLNQGGRRKGLSMLESRTIQNVKRLVVYVEPLSFTDLLFIAQTMYPKIPMSKLECMVRFNMEVRHSDFFILHHTGVTPFILSLNTCIFGLHVLSSRLEFMILAKSGSFNEIYLMDIKILLNVNEIYKETMLDVLWGQRGSPWEFNLRDLFRWCDLLIENQSLTDLNPGEFVGLVYRERMRTLTDKQMASKSVKVGFNMTKPLAGYDYKLTGYHNQWLVFDLYTRIFPPCDHSPYSSTRALTITNKFVQVGHSFLKCKQESKCCHGDQGKKTLYLLHHCLEPLESVMKCIEMNWMTILNSQSKIIAKFYKKKKKKMMIGPQSSGKTCLIQLLSELTGNQLKVLAMNSSMDTTELLGGFEQLDISHHLEEAASLIGEVITKVKVENLQSLDLKNIKPLEKTWRHYKSLDMKVGTQSVLEEQQKMKMKVLKLMDVVKEVKKIPHHHKIIESASLSGKYTCTKL